MGLDMYARTTSTKLDWPVDFEIPDKDGASEDLHYWRKHPDLHGWMQALYRTKGGDDPSFNCVNLQLTAEDLDALEDAVRQRMLPPTTGFFFGESGWCEREEDDLEFIAKARAALAQGLTVYYSAWW